VVLALAFQGSAVVAGHSAQLESRFFEYCLAIPANRYGSAVYTAAQLKTMQEVIIRGVT
jgi:uncharacterized protein (DUF486 family)